MKNPVWIAALSSIFLAACSAPLSKKDLNSGLFKNTEVFESKVEGLHYGDYEEKVLSDLGLKADSIKVENLEILGPDDTWKYVYGRTEVRATPSEIENYRKNLIAPYKAYRIPYSHVERWVSPGITANAKLISIGYDLSVVLVFENNKLWRAPIEGRPKINENETIYLWELLGDTVGGAASQGGKEAIRSVQ